MLFTDNPCLKLEYIFYILNNQISRKQGNKRLQITALPVQQHLTKGKHIPQPGYWDAIMFGEDYKVQNVNF